MISAKLEASGSVQCEPSVRIFYIWVVGTIYLPKIKLKILWRWKCADIFVTWKTLTEVAAAKTRDRNRRDGWWNRRGVLLSVQFMKPQVLSLLSAAPLTEWIRELEVFRVLPPSTREGRQSYRIVGGLGHIEWAPAYYLVSCKRGNSWQNASIVLSVHPAQ